MLCTEGGLRKDGVWQPVHLFPAQQYRRLWQHFLLSGLRKELKGKRGLCRLVGSLYNKYPTGFHVNVMISYFNGKQAAAYCCRFTGRPPFSEKRITAYDGKQVTVTYTDYRDNQEKTMVLPALRGNAVLEQVRLRRNAHAPPKVQANSAETAQLSLSL